MTLNPHAQGQYLEEEEEQNLSMQKMDSKHVNSREKMSVRNLNQDIKSIASKEYLRGRSTTNKSGEYSPSQNTKDRANSRVRDSQMKDDYSKLASSVKVSRKIRKDTEQAAAHNVTSSKLSKNVNLRDFNMTGKVIPQRSQH